MMAVVCALREKVVHLIKLRQQCVAAIRNSVKHSFSVSANEAEYTERPKYPPILDLSRRAIRERKEREWHEKIRSLETVEEKLFALNLPRYYGWRSLLLTEGHLLYDTFKFFRYITRTQFSSVEELPFSFENNDTLSDDLFNKIKNDVQDALVFEYKCRRRKEELDGRNNLDEGKMENAVAASVIKQINRILLANLSPFIPHLLTAQVDFEPRVEAFWFVGGMEPSRRQRKGREGMKFLTKEDVERPADRPVQYFGSPVLQLRHELPLPVVDTEKLQPEGVSSIEHFQFDPRVLGYGFTHQNGTTIPGFWPGDDCEFGLTSFHTRGHLYHRREFCSTYDEEEALHSQAILASYAWLLAQACYKGFSTYNDVTYPFVTQTVVTNGQLWSLYTYQLNTTLVHSEYALRNEECNFCWGTAPLKLFEEVKDTEVVGFNDKLLKMIIALYTTAPQERVGVNLRPYLKEGKHLVALIDDPERREWLETRFKHMYSCRPRMRLPYELYHWEKIYKVDHKTRPMDARRRPFELGINPFRRQYDEHVPEYIPKSLRPEEDKKTKWKKTYYPLSENDYKKSRK
ncbi:39S ribosomal protein S30, mitochondrial [Schistocerca serialis cubense]|uniref:39S ribosomal protein S30, mitochondrial n=1 Tax=Schistocerca serialis cubense TaxID=2023355 RepID=UPI00214EED6A|nr:39S ribosomal protein S30, mitochondrial [Schistocerca serialis cubense]